MESKLLVMSNHFLFQCPLHGADWAEQLHPDCCECVRLYQLNLKNKEIASRTTRRPRLREEVYWPREMAHNGRLIENLDHTPKFFSEKRKFRDYLKANNIREAS